MVTKTLQKSPNRLHVIDVDKCINIVVDYVGIKKSVKLHLNQL
jgi:hydrogenase maturation factor